MFLMSFSEFSWTFFYQRELTIDYNDEEQAFQLESNPHDHLCVSKDKKKALESYLNEYGA